MPEWVKASAALPPALEEDRVLTDPQVQAWQERGFTLVDGVLPGDLVTRATADATRVFPRAGSPETEAVTDFGSMGKMEFPAESEAVNASTLHPRLLRALAQLLGVKGADLRLTQADLWPKYGRDTNSGADRDNTDQRMHVDYPNHTLTHPPPWGSPEAVEIILYLSDVDDCGGATALVPRSGDHDPAYAYPIVNTPGVGRLEWINDRSHAEAYLSEAAPEIAEWRAKHLYPREVRARFQVGTILFYRQDTWHRGTPLARGAMRLVHNMTFRRAGGEWISTLHSGWAWAMYRRSKVMERLIASATVEPRCVLGFPEPGHPYWTTETVAAVSARYGALGIDMTAYEQALPGSERHARTQRRGC